MIVDSAGDIQVTSITQLNVWIKLVVSKPLVSTGRWAVFVYDRVGQQILCIGN
jgi:hypothetical protein